MAEKIIVQLRKGLICGGGGGGIDGNKICFSVRKQKWKVIAGGLHMYIVDCGVVGVF